MEGNCSCYAYVCKCSRAIYQVCFISHRLARPTGNWDDRMCVSISAKVRLNAASVCNFADRLLLFSEAKLSLPTGTPTSCIVVPDTCTCLKVMCCQNPLDDTNDRMCKGSTNVATCRHDRLAQWIARQTSNLKVAGSSPALVTSFCF